MEVFGIIAPHPPILLPEVGGVRSRVTEASARALTRAGAALHSFDPATVVVMSPHSPALSDAFAIDGSASTSGSLASFGAPRVHLEYEIDTVFTRTLIANAEAEGLPVLDRSADLRLHPGELDHGVIVPLSFLVPAGSCRVVCLSLSGLPLDSHALLGTLVARIALEQGTRVAFVASGDLSHRLTPDAPAGYSPQAARLDAEIVDRVARGDLDGLASIPDGLVRAGGECGLRSFVTLSGFTGPSPVPTRVLAYEGPWGVGYLTALVGQAALVNDSAAPPDINDTPDTGFKGGSIGEGEHEVVRLARTAIERFVHSRTVLDAPELTDPSLPERAGCFVSLHAKGALRGCIGTMRPTTPSLAEEIARNAIQAATRDPRFEPVTADELAGLDISVDILHEPEPASAEHLDPRTFGVIVRSGTRCGVLLPDLDGVPDVETQLLIALRKAGIGTHEPYSIERFRVDRYR